MTLAEWIKRYEDKAEPFVMEPGFSLFFDSEHGFLCWKVEGDTLHIDHTSTDDWAWMRGKVVGIAREHGCRRLMTFVFRNPRAYARLTGAHLLPGESRILANGKFYWAFEELI